MSATFNWAYQPGVTNKYGLTIPSGADNVRPAGFVYVALFGNDATGNGSRQLPYRTITKAVSLGTNYIIAASGVYREAATIPASPGTPAFVGDGDVILDATYNTSFYAGGQSKSNQFYNLTFRGNGLSNVLQQGANIASFTDCKFIGCAILQGGQTGSGPVINCIFANIVYGLYFSSAWSGNTFVNCSSVDFDNAQQNVRQNIFYNCNIAANIGTWLYFGYNLFYQCNFKFTSNGGVVTGLALHPGLPAGYQYFSTIAALQNAYAAAGGAGTPFTTCIFSDPLFNNLSIGDYSLRFSSPAKNLSYFGTYVGAQSIAYQVKASAIESAGSFDFSTNVNLNIADDSITLADSTQNASIQTNLISNTAGRQISKFPIYGFNADRSGQYIDSIPDLSAVINNPGDTLNFPAPYLVLNGAITYNASVYQPGDRFTSISGATTFSSSTNGTVQEILEAPERHTIMMRCGNGHGTIAAGTALTVSYWYYVQTGSITYDSVVYNSGSVFKAVDTNAFTGAGTVLLALSTETFQHYEPGIQPTSNNTGNTATGSIIRGNGDPAYVRGGYGITEFPINAKFIQLYYFIYVNNLKP